MPILFMIGLAASWCPSAPATMHFKRCEAALNQLDPDLRFEAGRVVRYRNTTIPLSPAEFMLLRLIVEAPREVISFDDLIRRMWGLQPPRNPKANIRVHLGRLRAKFSNVDPGFDKLRLNFEDGLYWSRTRHETFDVGRVGVARFIHEGYADEHAISLTPGEHAILTLLLKRDLVDVAMAPTIKLSTFKSLTSSLNLKFEARLGERLLVPGPYGTVSYRLNRSLW